MKGDWRTADLTERRRAMLAYAEKLTLRPGGMAAADAQALRDCGLRDEEILALVLVAGFFNLAVRIADALGVELDPQLSRGTKAYAEYFERKKR